MGHAVHIAVRRGDNELLTYILVNGGDLGQRSERYRYSYICMSLDFRATANNEEVARILIRYVAKLDFTKAGCIAVDFGHLDLVCCFLGLGADINSLGLKIIYTCSPDAITGFSVWLC